MGESGSGMPGRHTAQRVCDIAQGSGDVLGTLAEPPWEGRGRGVSMPPGSTYVMLPTAHRVYDISLDPQQQQQ
jgi:hypothetical protein